MRDNIDKPTEPTFNKVIKYFTLAMSLVYPAIGLYLLFSSEEQLAINGQVKIILGIVLILYGILRFLRSYKRYYNNSDNSRLQ